jgi:ribosome maturation factor RimP
VAAPSAVDRVRAIAAIAAGDAGLVVEDVTITPAGRRRVLRVVVDLPEDVAGGVGMAAIGTTSQALSAALDADGVMGETPYVLEVTSPGVDRPLTERRHFARARGRLVRFVLTTGEQVVGRVAGVDEAGVALSDGQLLGWDPVVRGRVEVEFSRGGEEDLVPDGDAGAEVGDDLDEQTEMDDDPRRDDDRDHDLDDGREA